MNRMKLLVQLAAMSLLAGCQSKDTHYDEAPKQTRSQPPQQSSFQSFWSNMKSKLHLTSSIEMPSSEIDQYSLSLIRSKETFSHVMQVCEQNGLPTEAAFIPLLISDYNPEFNSDGHAGIWGLNDVQASALGLTNDYWHAGKQDIMLSTQSVVSYLKFLHTAFNDDWALAFTAYKYGITPVMRAVHQNQSLGRATSLEELPLEPEMKAFSKNLSALSQAMVNSSSDLSHGQIQAHDSLIAIDMPSQFDLGQTAGLLKIDLPTLKALNAGNKRPLSPPQGPFRIIVPTSHALHAQKVLKDPSLVSQVAKKNWVRHKVHSGESLSLIAQNYMTKISDLKRVNNLESDQIKVNQLILIPPVDKTESRTKASDTPGPQRVIHTVQANDTLYSIAKTYKQRVDHVMYWNNLSEKALRPGQQLVMWKNTHIESPYIYHVKANDSLSKIAKAHHTSIEKIKTANHLTSSVIHPNDTLVIPHESKG